MLTKTNDEEEGREVATSQESKGYIRRTGKILVLIGAVVVLPLAALWASGITGCSGSDPVQTAVSSKLPGDVKLSSLDPEQRTAFSE